MTRVTSVTRDDFRSRVLNNPKPVLVDFFGESCSSCRMLEPVLEDLAASQNAMDIVKLNVDEYPDIAVACDVLSVPSMQVYLSGQLVKHIVGAKPRSVLEAEVGEFIR